MSHIGFPLNFFFLICFKLFLFFFEVPLMSTATELFVFQNEALCGCLEPPHKSGLFIGKLTTVKICISLFLGGSRFSDGNSPIYCQRDIRLTIAFQIKWASDIAILRTEHILSLNASTLWHLFYLNLAIQNPEPLCSNSLDSTLHSYDRLGKS